jgi:hypothetical protein
MLAWEGEWCLSSTMRQLVSVWDVELDRRNEIRHGQPLPSEIRLTLNVRWHNEVVLLYHQSRLCHVLPTTCLFDRILHRLPRRLHGSSHLASSGLSTGCRCCWERQLPSDR